MRRSVTSGSRTARRRRIVCLLIALAGASAARANPPLPWRPTAPEAFRAALPSDDVEEARRLGRLGPDFRIERTDHFSLAVQRDSRTASYRGKILEDLHAAFTLHATRLGFELTPGVRKHAMVFTPTRAQFLELVGADGASPGLGGAYLHAPRLACFYDTLGRQEDRTRMTRAGEIQGDLRRMRREIARLPADATVELRYRQAPTRRYARDEALARLDEALRRVRREGVELVYRLGEDSLGIMLHEAAHQLTFEMGLVAAGRHTPLWLIEGLATLFEPIRHGFLLETNQPHWGRWANLEARRRAGDPIDVPALIAKDDGFRGDDPTKSARAYDDAWGLVHFLSTREPTGFTRYVKRVQSRREEPNEAQRTADFEESFGTPVAEIASRLHRFLEELGQGSEGGLDAYRSAIGSD